MRHRAVARARTLGPAAIGLLVVTAAVTGTFVAWSTSSAAPTDNEALTPGGHRGPPLSASSSGPSFNGVPRGGRGVPITEEDGALPDGVTPFDDGYPGVANLDPDLLQALRVAATQAADGGVELHIASGWRSPEYQDQLLRAAVFEYGSEAEAARWVATPGTSPHVSGNAVDVGAVDATTWLSEHGAAYGLCQIYRNEPWHFELHPRAADRGCPRMYDDPTHDPRIVQ